MTETDQETVAFRPRQREAQPEPPTEMIAAIPEPQLEWIAAADAAIPELPTEMMARPSATASSQRRPLAALAVITLLLSGLTIGFWLQTKTPASVPAVASSAGQSAATQSGPAAPAPELAQPAMPAPPAPDLFTPNAARPAPPAAPGAGAPPPAAGQPPAPAPAPPRVVSQAVGPNPIKTVPCGGGRAMVVATVVADGELSAVALFSKAPDGSGAAVPMIRYNGQWIAGLGPYQTAGVATWIIAAVDSRGVTSYGPPSALPVLGC